MADNNDTSSRGLGSDSMSEQEKHRIQSMGGKASAKSRKGVAGRIQTAQRGGENSHKSQQ